MTSSTVLAAGSPLKAASTSSMTRVRIAGQRLEEVRDEIARLDVAGGRTAVRPAYAVLVLEAPRRLADEDLGGAMGELARDVADVRVVDALVLAEAGEHEGLKVGERADHGLPAREVGAAGVVDAAVALVGFEQELVSTVL